MSALKNSDWVYLFFRSMAVIIFFETSNEGSDLGNGAHGFGGLLVAFGGSSPQMKRGQKYVWMYLGAQWLTGDRTC